MKTVKDKYLVVGGLDVNFTHFNEQELKDTFTSLLNVRDAVMKALEESRSEKTIGTAQEAHAVIECTKADKELLEGTLNVAQWLIVSKATLKEAETNKVSILKATGDKCPRCWNYTEEADENGLCPRCHRVMSK